jgi:hypothetical protein
MPVVCLRGPLKRLAGDCPEHVIEGASVDQLLQELERAHPAASGWILDERGVLRAISTSREQRTSGQHAHVDADDRIDVLPRSRRTVTELPSARGRACSRWRASRDRLTR